MRVKRLLTLTLVFVLLFTSIIPVMADNPVPGKGKPVTEREQKVFDKTTIPRLEDDARNGRLKDDQEVRIIVQLDKAPLTDYAIKKGVKVNQLSSAIVKTATNDIYTNQKSVKEAIEASQININYHESFINVINGFSGTTTYAEAKVIEKLPGVKSVYIANEYMRPNPDMNTSVDIVNARETWDLGYKGEGMIAAIIDTGIDPSHKDMRLTDESTSKLDRNEVNLLIAENKLSGKYFSSKVPYGYNYYDNNLEILDLGPGASMHGMHVAGTVGANGDENGIKGVAPEIQLLAMKVFGNDPGMASTFGDIIIRAIDDSVKLGADVINMSLGSTASYVLPNDPEQQAVTNAAMAGVMLSISAGNSDKFGSGWDLPYNTNPDVGVVGSPGLTAESLQVSSIENTHVKAYALEYFNGTETKMAGYFPAGPADPIIEFAGEQMEYVDCGLGGTAADFEGKDLVGRIALVKRGTYDFTVKIENAEAAGAAGIIVWNDEARGEALVSMRYPENGTIPALFIANSHGAALKGLLGTENAKVEFKGNQTTVLNTEIGKMSSFTSWGPTPNLEFKPEITAPGGQIYSTLNDDEYGIMSGTSMAAPHVAGGSALVLERVDEEFPDLEGLDKINMAKNILMSTAQPLVDKGFYNTYFENGSFYSPRSQGAGVMDIFAAVNTPAVVYDKDTKLSKVNLREIDDVTEFVITVENFSTDDVTYVVNGNVQTDLMVGGYIEAESNLIFNADTIDPETYMGECPIEFPELADGKVTIPANSAVDITVSLDLASSVDWWYNAPLDMIYPNGTFVEGFVQFTDEEDSVPALSIPYVGFYGEWDKAPVIDGDVYGMTGDSFYGYSGLLFKAPDDYYYLGEVAGDDILFGISPNGDGVADNVLPILSFLRNAKVLDIEIYNAEGTTKLRDIAREENIRKHFFDSDGPIYTFKDSWAWDGTVKNKVVDGEYMLRISATVDYPDAEPQIIEYQVIVDNEAPELKTFAYDKETYKLTVAAEDENPIVDYRLYNAADDSFLAVSKSGEFDLTAMKNDVISVYAVATDIGLNQVVTPNAFLNDEEIANIFMNSPEPFGIYNTGIIDFEGYVTDASGLKSLTINGVNVPFEFNQEEGHYYFATTMNFEDGLHKIDVDAVDNSDNAINFERTIYVDTHSPEIDMTEVPEDRIVENEIDSVNLKGTITDIFSFLRVRVNGDEIFFNPDESEYEDKFTTPAHYDLNQEVTLDLGENIITVEAEDIAGNVSKKTYNVYRKDVGEEDPDLGESPVLEDIELNNATNVSSARPVTITATANQEVDWTVVIKSPRGDVEKTFQDFGNTFEAEWAPDVLKKLNGEYKVEITIEKDGVSVDYSDENIVFWVYNYPIKINAVDVVNRDGVVTAEAEIINLGPSETNPMLIVQVLDENGNVVNISTAKMNGMLDQQVVTLGSGFGLSRPGTYTAEVFVWTGWDDAEALSPPVTVTFEIE